MPLISPRTVVNWSLGVLGTLVGALCLWVASLVWASKADASAVQEISGRVDTLQEMRGEMRQRLDRIENKLDALGRGPK